MYRVRYLLWYLSESFEEDGSYLFWHVWHHGTQSEHYKPMFAWHPESQILETHTRADTRRVGQKTINALQFLNQTKKKQLTSGRGFLTLQLIPPTNIVLGMRGRGNSRVMSTLFKDNITNVFSRHRIPLFYLEQQQNTFPTIPSFINWCACVAAQSPK